MDGNGIGGAGGTNGVGPPLRLLGIGGSTRPGSLTLAALAAALGLAAAAGTQTRLVDVRALGLPLYEEGRALGDYPASLVDLLGEARRADAFLLCTPTYLGTMAGGMKNALDALSFLAGDDPPYLGGKPVGLLALGGANAADALTALAHAARSLNGLVVPTAVAVPPRSLDRERGGFADEAVERRVGRMVGEVVDLGRRLRRPTFEVVSSAGTEATL